jgi:tetratricopeptide (TPR) repeat protein
LYVESGIEALMHPPLFLRPKPTSMKRILYFITLASAFILLTGRITLAESANSYFNQGFELHQKGDLNGAIRLYSKAVENNPAFPMAYQMRGVALQQLKKYPQAMSDYSMVITFGEPYFKSIGYYNRGIVKNITGDFAGAIPDFSQAIELDKKMAAAFFHRGIAKSKTGDLIGRMEDFREAARLGDSNAETWLNTYYPGWKLLPITASPT